ncbi:protein jim lovell-like isoform X3 [Trichogramma pretiosum]|uniref:protein jim lovell-like isoform X3 n=1 Tax=Trichogramma pretiosum TaxID=7493 RepID=UPI0006C95C93|nr:protein jim lovell-like isoform X3 [Trichogramma pretiosum]
MGTSQQFSLRWNNYLKHITSAFDTLRCDEDLVDVTLSCEGKRIRAHKMLLSACSTYFRDLFKENPCQHPVIIFRNVKFDDLAALVDFIYQGEVNVVQEQLDSFMTTAELLAVQGLTDGTRRDDSVEEEVEIPSEPEVQLRNPSGKLITNNRRHKSPASPQETHRSEAPGPKRRRIRENNTHTEKSTRHTVTSPKESDNGKVDPKAGSDPVEIIPIMPGLKMEIPEYLEQDGGSSCSYEEQSVECPRIVMEEEENITDGDKPDIGQPFYQADTLDVSKSSDIGYLLAKPGTSAGNRTSHDSRDSHETVETPFHVDVPMHDVVDPLQDDLMQSFDEPQPHQPLQEQQLQPLPQLEMEQRQPPNPSDAPVVAVAPSVAAPTSRCWPNSINPKRNSSNQEKGRWVCDVCGKVYARGDSLAHHRSIHRGDTVCPVCQVVFTRKYTMRCHMANVHGMQLPT